METAVDTPAPPLADVTACGACGYVIVALPPEGTCPECGRPYDRRELVLLGVARGRLATDRNGGRRHWATQLAFAVPFLFLAGLTPLRGSWFVWGSAAGFVLPAVVAGARWLFTSSSATVRVTLAGQGCGQEDLSPPTRGGDAVAMGAAFLPTLLMSADYRGQLGWRGAGVLSTVMLALLILAWWARRRRPGASAPKPMASWRTIRVVRLSPAGPDRWRLQAEPSDGRRARPIDAEVDATPEQVAALRAFAGRCSRWIEG